MSDSLWQNCSTPGFSVLHYPAVCSNSCPSSWWYHPTISSFLVPFSSCLQSFPASKSFPLSQLFASGGQSIRTVASESVFPMNIQYWFLLGFTSCWPRDPQVFSSTTVWTHQFLVHHFLYTSNLTYILIC